MNWINGPRQSENGGFHTKKPVYDNSWPSLMSMNLQTVPFDEERRKIQAVVASPPRSTVLLLYICSVYDFTSGPTWQTIRKQARDVRPLRREAMSYFFFCGRTDMWRNVPSSDLRGTLRTRMIGVFPLFVWWWCVLINWFVLVGFSVGANSCVQCGFPRGLFADGPGSP